MNFNHLKPETVTAYLAHELPAQDKYNADAHLAVCPECAAKLDRQRREREKISKAFARSPESGMILSGAGRSAVDEEIRAGIGEDSSSARAWTRRIRRSLLIQIFSILLAGGILAFLLFLPRPEKKETVVPPAPAPAPETVAESTPEVPSETPPPAEETQPESVSGLEKPFLQSRELIEKLGLEKIPSAPAGEADTLLQVFVSAVRFPFASDSCVVYADALPGKNVSVSLELLPPDEVRSDACALRPGSAPNAHSLLLGHVPEGTELPPLKLSIRCSSPDGTVRETFLPVPGKILDFHDGQARVRLAALLHAASNPYLLLNKQSRAEILRDFDALLKSEYAAREDVRRLTEQLRRIK